jgi:repressor LexA
MNDDLTERERAALGYIKARVEDSGFPPTMREIALALGSDYPNTARYLVLRLESKGYIKRRKGQARAIEILKKSQGEK